MNILFIPKWYPSRVHELNGNFIKRHAIAVAMKHKVAVVFVSADPNMKDKMYDAEYEIDNEVTTVKIFYNNSFPDFFILSPLVKLFRYLKSCWLGIKIINEEFGKPDICHIHVLTRTFFIAYYYKFFYSIPFLISEQWTGYFPENGNYRGFVKKMITKIAIRKASVVTVVSESLKNAMLAHDLKNNYCIIPNVVDTRLFFPSLEKKKEQKFVILHVSNLNDRAKNISGMINAVKKLSRFTTNFEFHIMGGDEPQRSKFECLSMKYNLLNSALFFHGWKKTHEVAEMMRKADIFVLFSNYETISCVMIESFASGVPVICSSIDVLKEHLKQDMGILVSPRDEDALCEGMLKAMDNIQSFDSKQLHKYAKENFSYEVVAKQFDVIYKKIIQN